jgi:hypothetical protein
VARGWDGTRPAARAAVDEHDAGDAPHANRLGEQIHHPGAPFRHATAGELALEFPLEWRWQA